jgi:hypothetical protein
MSQFRLRPDLTTPAHDSNGIIVGQGVDITSTQHDSAPLICGERVGQH